MSRVRGIISLAASALLFLSLIAFGSGNWFGVIGHGIAAASLYLFGLGSYLLVAGGALWGWKALRGQEIPKKKLLLFGLCLLSTCLMLNVFAELLPRLGYLFRSVVITQIDEHVAPLAYRQVRFNIGGVPLYALLTDLPRLNLAHLLSLGGTLLISLAGTITTALLLSELSLRDLASQLRERFKRPPAPQPAYSPPPPRPVVKEVIEEELPPPPPKPAKKVKIRERIVSTFSGFKLPPANLLTSVPKVDLSSLKKDLSSQSQVLEETFSSFGIEARVVDINCGPSITSFEVQPAIGVKVQRIKALEKDIALNMQARSIRILAPIPGKAAVGIEVPNPRPQEVGFREMLTAYRSGTSQFHLPILLGKAVNGDDVATDLAKMPHCIIAGATGSGKSVCINTIIMSLVMNLRPDQVRLLMVDPKKVELTPYTRLPHMLAPVITEPFEACTALNWLVKEMERRYELLKKLGLRNIVAFNQRKPDRAFEESLDIDVPERLTYFVGIIDELADLMMASSSDIETPITRIAQMARAVGIHLIIATQRPSREVITGLIKANFPTRISFKVASRVNSQIILDDVGAETLMGNGDMLFLPPGASNLMRAQGTYIRDEDINAVIDHLCMQAPTEYLIQSFNQAEFGEETAEEDKDSFYKQALEIVTQSGIASTTFLQRKLKVGYARAASIMDQFEADGVVGPQEGSKPRQVLRK